jgi:hypothetical protein
MAIMVKDNTVTEGCGASRSTGTQGMIQFKVACCLVTLEAFTIYYGSDIF